MPYYLHPKTYATEDEVLEHFCGPTADDTVRVFATVIDARKGIDPKTQTVTFIPDHDEQMAWMAREGQRFEDGTYIPVPWASKWGVEFDHYHWPETTHLHYPHLSTTHPGLIAYTKNPEHGHHDRQTRVTPGRYLEEFWKGYKYGSMSFDAEFPDWIARCKAENLQLRIATDPDDIEKIYLGGPRSCMSPGPRIAIHPTRVYGAPGDLAVAYLGPIEAVSARAVVWPERKRYVRIYGDPTLKVLLTQAGYTRDNFDGAHIRRIFIHGQLVLPYIDGANNCPYVTYSGDERLLTLSEKRGDYSACETTGFAKGSSSDVPEDDDDDMDDPDYADLECDHCGDSYSYATQTHGALNRQYCDDCIESRHSCDNCDWQGWESTTITADGAEWCAECIHAAVRTCTRPITVPRTDEYYGIAQGAGSVIPCGEEWNEAVEFTASEQEQRDELGIAHLCRDCADGMQACKHCAALFPDTDTACTECRLAVRCASTLPLNLVPMRPAIVAMWKARAPRDSYSYPGYPDIRWFLTADGRAHYLHISQPDAWNDSTFDSLDTHDTFERVYAESACDWVDPNAYFLTAPVSLTLNETEMVS